MNLHHLRIFHAVALTGSTVAASEQLLISQSAVSSQLKQLEASLKTSLVERAGRGLALTEAGRTLKEYADRIFSLADEAIASVDNLKRLKQGRLSIGATPTIGTYFLPRLLVHFQRRFPQIELSVEIEDHAALQQRMHDGFIELAFTPVGADGEEVRSNRFMQDELIAVVSSEHPLAVRKKILPKDLQDVMLARRLPSATGSLVHGYFSKQKIAVKPLLSLSSIEAVKQAAVAGLGVAILPRMSVQAEIEHMQLKLLNLAGLPLRRPLFTLRRNRSASKAAIAFECLLKHAVRGTLPRLTQGVR